MNGIAGTTTVHVKADLSNVMDGDIVCKLHPHEHIGLLIREGGKVLVIQAEETVKGLTDTEVYEPSKWEKTVRVLDSFLVPRKHGLKDGNGN
jgi:hypothetical protein